MPHARGFRRFLRARDDRVAVDDELRFHLESRVDDLVARGLAPGEARRVAETEFGDVGGYRDVCIAIDQSFAREASMREIIETTWADLRHAVRTFRREAGFTAVAVGTLALGIGASTSVFSAVEGVLLRPLAYADANRIVHVGEQRATKPGRGGTTSFDNFDDWRRSARAFSAMGLVASFAPTLLDRGDPERVPVALVTSGIFDVFHVTPYRGRRIEPGDANANAPAVTLLSYEYWQSRLGGDAAIVGSTLRFDFGSVRVIGILPPRFRGPGRLDRPMWGNFTPDTSDGRAGRSKDVYALLQTGVTADAAQAEMTRLSQDLAARYPDADKGQTAIVDPLAARTVGDLARPLYLLLAASVALLLIACANVSNLLLARGVARRRELAVRSALGAGRRRLIRQLMTESVVLAVGAACIGVGLAAAMLGRLRTTGPDIFDVRPPVLDAVVVFAAVVGALVSAVVLGVVPAIRLSPARLEDALRAGGTRGATAAGGRTIRALAVTQLALALVLLSASGLVAKSLIRVLDVEPGIRADHLLTMTVTLPRARYDSLRSTAFYRQLSSALSAAPGVRSAATTSLVPFSGDFDRVNIQKIRGQPDRSGADAATADRYVVSPTYFETVGVRLLHGRLPGAGDVVNAPTVCLVDEVFARRIFGGESAAIGRVMTIPGSVGDATIVGVVGHVKTYGLDAESPGQLYLSNEQVPWRWSSIVVRTVGSPAALAPLVAREVHRLDPAQAIAAVSTMDQLMSSLLRARRFTVTVFGLFAALALVVSAIGLYGVIAYGVSQRRREFGVRLALGAQPRQLMRMVVASGVRLAVAGALIGAVVAFAAGRLLASLLFEVSAHDGSVYAAVGAVLIGVALLASAAPALRAARVGPTEALREG